jgi:hypothetical protein
MLKPFYRVISLFAGKTFNLDSRFLGGCIQSVRKADILLIQRSLEPGYPFSILSKDGLQDGSDLIL